MTLPAGVVVSQLDDLAPIQGQSFVEGDWKPVRAHFGIQAFGINAYVADNGQIVVEEHNELKPDDPEASHTELYVVVRGHAEFTLGEEQVDAPAGTMVFLSDPAVTRQAVAREDGTTVLAIGGPVGRPFSVSDWEAHWTRGLGPAATDS